MFERTKNAFEECKKLFKEKTIPEESPIRTFLTCYLLGLIVEEIETTRNKYVDQHSKKIGNTRISKHIREAKKDCFKNKGGKNLTELTNYLKTFTENEDSLAIKKIGPDTAARYNNILQNRNSALHSDRPPTITFEELERSIASAEEIIGLFEQDLEYIFSQEIHSN